LATGLARVGRLPLLGRLELADAAVPNGSGGEHNSAQRLLAVWSRFRVPPDLSAALSDTSGPVLLVDDRVATGWTMTVAARLLREAGAPAVLPLTLAMTA
ncbi:MAG TPA: recombinase RecQ, partial [Candidatus Dormibacteraeota bacterium]